MTLLHHKLMRSSAVTEFNILISGIISKRVTFWTLLKVLALVAFFTYGFEMFNFNFTIDEEYLASYTKGTPGWIDQGRWAMYLLSKYLFPFTVLPVIPLLFSLIFYILGTAIILKIMDENLSVGHCAAGCIIVTFPSLMLVFNFSTLVYGIGVGVFLVSQGLNQSFKQTKISFFLCISYYAIAIGIYQSFLFLIFGLAIMFLIYQHFQNPTKFQTVNSYREYLVKNFLLIFSALILYYAIHKSLLWALNLKIAYIDGFYNPSYLISHTREVLSTTQKAISGWIFNGKDPIFQKQAHAYKYLIKFCYVVIIMNLLRLKITILQKIILFILFFIVMITPFLLHLINRGSMPDRSLVALPFMVGMFILIAYLTSNKCFKFLILILSAFVTLQFSIISVRLQNSSHISLVADRLIGSRIIERIDLLRSKDKELKSFEVIGSLPTKPSNLLIKNETIGASFFEWDQGSPGRILAFLDTLGLKGLVPVQLEQRSSYIKIVNEMPIWPQAGSIVILGDTVILKLNNYSDYQKSQICGYDKNHSMCI